MTEKYNSQSENNIAHGIILCFNKEKYKTERCVTMQAIQYFTDPGHTLQARILEPAQEMGGAITAHIGQKAYDFGFEGFGVAITGSSCYNLSLMEPAERRALLEQIYSPKGLGLSVARISLGASDYSRELYSYDDVPGDVELKHFSVERDEAYIIPMIKEILAVNPDLKILASPWSPPGWMKTGGMMCGGHIREKYLECYAEYYLRFLQAYEERGIHIAALTPQNEPETQQFGKMPACQWHPDMEAKFVRILREKLDKAGMDTKIWILDYNFVWWRRPMWMLDTYPELQKQSQGIAFHYYKGGIEDIAPLQEKYPRMEYHFTEGGPRLYDNYGTDWCKWTAMMIKVMSRGFRSFCGWNLMLDETGGPNIGPYFCGGLVTRDSRTGELSYSGQYKAFSNISRFIRPGARVRPVTLSGDGRLMFAFPKLPEPVEVCAAENPDGSFVLLASNHNNEKQQLQFFCKGQWWYVELMPDSVSTVVFDREP